MPVSNANESSCVDVCWDCHKICLSTALGHCLETGGKHTEPEHFRLMIACAEVCRSCAELQLGASAFAMSLCGLCADVCARCADSCADVGGMEDCVAACRACAASCAAMADTTTGAGA
jgi:hypothetical protein